MKSEFGNRAATYEETIARLKTELHKNVETLKASDAWPAVERDYRALRAIEELAGGPKTTLEQLLGVSTASETPQTPSTPGKPSELVLGEQQETEMAAEIEKGS